METPKPNESLRGPLHVLRCAGEYAVMGYLDKRRRLAEWVMRACEPIGEAQEIDYGDE